MQVFLQKMCVDFDIIYGLIMVEVVILVLVEFIGKVEVYYYIEVLCCQVLDCYYLLVDLFVVDLQVSQYFFCECLIMLLDLVMVIGSVECFVCQVLVCYQE